jgi:hypothetical protein
MSHPMKGSNSPFCRPSSSLRSKTGNRRKYSCSSASIPRDANWEWLYEALRIRSRSFHWH